MDAFFDLERFVAAQNPVMPQVVAELEAGRKRSHWMWFVFPQLSGLGSSATACRFAITSIEEAGAYAGHPVLGPRLHRCTGLVIRSRGQSALDIFGSPDDVKFYSSMTLFAVAQPAEPLFTEALDTFFGGSFDTRTLALLEMPSAEVLERVVVR